MSMTLFVFAIHEPIELTKSAQLRMNKKLIGI